MISRKDNDKAAHSAPKCVGCMVVLAELQASLLAAEPEDNFYDTAAGILGRSLGASRLWICEANQTKKDDLATTLCAEWSADGVAAPDGAGEMRHFSLRDHAPRWAVILQSCGSIHDLTDNLPDDERRFFSQRGVKSVMVEPLVAGEGFFGLIGGENCKSAAMWEQQQVELLRRAASALSLACERRQSHRIMRGIISSAPVAMAIFDREMRYLAFSQKWIADYGLSGQKLIGRSHYEVFPDTPDRWRDLHKRALDGELITMPEDTFVRADGLKICLRWALEPWPDLRGGTGGIVMVTEPITDLVDARNTAIAASRAKSAFLAVMSHAIRTPMTGVIGMAELMIETPLNVEQREYAEAIHSSGESLLKIINDISDFSKIEVGRIDLEVVDFDVRMVLEDVADLVSADADEKNLEMATLAPTDMPTRVKGDAMRIRQILSNFADNAVKFTSSGSVTLSVSCKEQNTTHATCRFEVRDTGVGIPRAQLKRLFDPFSLPDAIRPRSFGGAGLGLAISKQLAELMGGSVGVESREGKGSFFWFTVKLEKQAQALPPTSPLIYLLNNLRVLIVSHYPASADSVSRQLRSWGMRCELVERGIDALSKLEEAFVRGEPFDISIINMELPDGNAHTLAHTIKMDPKIASTYLMLMIANGRRTDSSSMRQMGFVGQVLKPVKQAQLMECLLNVIMPSTEIRGDLRFAAGAKSAERHYNLHVLIAEDNPINQKVALKMMEKLGCSCDLVSNGRDAVSAVAQKAFDLIIMDCQMPEMDGYDATRNIRMQEGDKKHTLIVAMTANAMKGDREKCLLAGMDDYISKPVSIEDMVKTLDRHMERIRRVSAAPASGSERAQ
ncbi:MAG: response regulator [bacterium]|nr:response regulator [Candidatus Sumerlaeota bacterium]